MALRRQLYIIVLLGIWAKALDAQQAAQYSLYMFNPYESNVAYAGFDGSISAAAVYRNQWSGLSGSPESGYLSIHAPVYRLQGAVGAIIEMDRLGVEENLRIGVSYNHIRQIDGMYFSLGMQLGYQQKTVDGSRLRARDGEYRDGQVQHNDPRLSEGLWGGGSPTIGLALYHINDYFEGGVQFSRLAVAPIEDTETGLSLQTSTHLEIYLASQYGLLEDMSVHGSLLVKSDFAQWQTELSSWLSFQESYSLGLSYRGFGAASRDALIIFGQIRLGDLWTAAYSYDLGISTLQRVHTGSHELMIKYILDRRIGEPRQTPVVHNPRFLD